MTALPVGGPELPQRRTLVTEIPGPASRALMERRNSTVARGISTTLPVFITAAGGGVLLDADGNSLIDFGSGIAVASVGNAAAAVVSRVQQQVAQFTHTCFMVTPYEGYVEVCEQLARHTPGTHEKRSALFNSGAEAVENAIKIARHHTGRQAVVAFAHAYHGRTNLTMALTATRGEGASGAEGNWTEYIKALGGKLYRPDVAPADAVETEPAGELPEAPPTAAGPAKMAITNPLFESAPAKKK